MQEYVFNEANQQYYEGWVGNLRHCIQNWLKRQMFKQVHDPDNYLIKDLGMNRQEIDGLDSLIGLVGKEPL